ncbi:MAG: peptidoglycan recognition protein family protein, partial [Pseudoclavibacter sp.]
MGYTPLAREVRPSMQRSPRNGAQMRYFFLHHAVSTSVDSVVGMMTSGSREVSAHTVCGDWIVGVVDEAYSSWSLGSQPWERHGISTETINDRLAPNYTVSAKTFDNLARLIADWSIRYRIPITDATVLTHQEV